MLTLRLADEEATVALGTALGQAVDSPLASTPVHAQTGLIISLHGDLGAGKTTLSRGVLQAFGHADAVKSPTYTLVETYQLADWVLHHFDLYRLHDPEELEYMGIRDYFGADTVALVEWPQRGGGHFPVADLSVALTLAADGRDVVIEALSARGTQVLNRLKNILKH